MKHLTATDVCQMIARAIENSQELQDAGLVIMSGSVPSIERGHKSNYFQVYQDVEVGEDEEETAFNITVEIV